MNVRFRLDSKVYEGDLQIIMLDATFDNQRLRLSTGEKVHADNWDKNRLRVRSRMKGSAEINARIDVLEESVRKIYREFHLKRQVPTPQLIKQELRRGESQPGSFFDHFEEFIRCAEPVRRPTTIQNHWTCLKYLKKFQAATNHTLALESMDRVFYDKFVAYAYANGAKTNTVGSKISTLLAFLNWCVSSGIEVNPKYKEFKRLLQNTDSVALTLEELHQIEQLELPTGHKLHAVRDIFLLQCYTGLRYSDVVKLRPVNLKDDVLIVNTVKTADDLKLPLLPQALAIMRRCPEKGFPSFKNRHANKCIRQLCGLAGIDESTLMVEHRGKERIENVAPKHEFITTHTGRRTFVTLSLERGVRPEVLMRITGHKDIRTMQRYVKMTEKVTRNEFLGAWNTDM